MAHIHLTRDKREPSTAQQPPTAALPHPAVSSLSFPVTYLVASAPLVIKVLIRSSWPYLAATWRGVLPSLSTQSISPPERDCDTASCEAPAWWRYHTLPAAWEHQIIDFLSPSVGVSALQGKMAVYGDESLAEAVAGPRPLTWKSIRNGFEKSILSPEPKTLQLYSGSNWNWT